MARKVHEISFAIAGRLASTFRGTFSEASSQLRRLGDQSKQLKSSIRSLEDNYRKGVISVHEYTAAQQRLSQQLEKTKAIQQRLSAMQSKQNEIQANANKYRGQIMDTAAMGAPFIVAIKQAMAFEDAMLGVAKQAQGARDKNGQLTQVYYSMRQQIQALGREIPIATNELASMVEAGLRMGIPNEKIIEFTRNTAKMATAFEMPADEIADDMGKIANVMQIPIQKLNDLGDTINYLDDNSVAKGRDIIGVLLRTGGVLKQVNMNAGQGSALASTFLSLGKSEEVAATATNALIRELAIANQQPQRFQDGLEALGMTSEQVNKGMVKDAQGTILKVLKAINKLPKAKQAEVTTQLFGKEYGDDIAALSGAINEYQRQINMLNEAQRKGSMDREYQARLKNTSAQWQLFKNKAAEAGVTLGTVFLPSLNQTFDKVGSAITQVAHFAQAHPQLTNAIIATTTGLIGFRLAWVGTKFVINQGKAIVTDLASIFLRQAAAQTAATNATVIASVATGRLTIAQRLLNIAMAMNPIGLVIAGIGLLVGAGYLLYKNWDMVKHAGEQLWISMKIVFMNLKLAGLEAFQGLMNAAEPIISLLPDSVARSFDSMRQSISTSVAQAQADLRGLQTEKRLNNIVYSIGQSNSNDSNSLRQEQLATRMLHGSHRNGLSYVPFDGYRAELHKGERVLTSSENRVYSSGRSGLTIHLTYAPQISGGTRPEIEDILQRDKDDLLSRIREITHQEARVQLA